MKMNNPLRILLLLTAINVHAAEGLPELSIEKIHDGVYLHKSYQQVEEFGLVSSNGLVVVVDNAAWMVDTPWSEPDTAKLAGWIEQQGFELKGSVSTHSHDDRTAGVGWLNQNGVATWVSAQTNAILEQENKAPATHTFEGREHRWLDGKVEAFYPGGGHTVDNIVVWLPDSKILYGGCFIRSLASKGLGYTGEARIDQWSDSVRKVIERYPDALLVIPGHGKGGDRSLLTHTRELAESAPEAQTRG